MVEKTLESWGYGMAILMSIKPEYANRIFFGCKKFEYRKRIPKLTIDRVYVYSSYPVKKIIGYFEVDYVLQGTPEEIWNETCKFSGIDALTYRDYFSDCRLGYAIHILCTKLFDKPIDPHVAFRGFRAPQSFMYFNGSCFE